MEVPINRVWPTAGDDKPDKIKRFAKKPAEDFEPVSTLEVEGIHFVVDGNTRTLAAIMRGDKTILTQSAEGLFPNAKFRDNWLNDNA